MDQAPRSTGGRVLLVAPILLGVAVTAGLVSRSTPSLRVGPASAARAVATPAPARSDSLASPARPTAGLEAAHPAGTAGGGGAGGHLAPAPSPPPTAAPAVPPKPDTTLPANPALRSLEGRARYDAEQNREAVSRLAASLIEQLPASSAGHSGAVSPDLLPDMRPLQNGPADVPGKPFFVPDLLNPVFKHPVFKHIAGLFQATGQDRSNDPSPLFSEQERKQLVAEGKDLFFSTTAFGQRPSQGPLVAGQVLSCASCHSGQGFADGRTHLIGPVREREFGHRQTPGLFGVAHTAPFGWDGRNGTLQNQARGAIVSPLEMHSSREPTKRELDALAEFQRSFQEPPAVPGRDFDPVRAKRGEVLFRTPRRVVDPAGEFAPDEKVACATCHSGAFFTDGKAHRGALPTFFFGDPLFDPGRIGPDGNIQGFDTPSLLGARFTSPFFHDGIAGDPTAPSNLMGGGLGVGVLDGDVGATGPAAARRALLNNVLPFYNNIRFNFGFTQEELKDLAEFVLSL